MLFIQRRKLDVILYNKGCGILSFYGLQKTLGFKPCAKIAHPYFKIRSEIGEVGLYI